MIKHFLQNIFYLCKPSFVRTGQGDHSGFTCLMTRYIKICLSLIYVYNLSMSLLLCLKNGLPKYINKWLWIIKHLAPQVKASCSIESHVLTHHTYLHKKIMHWKPLNVINFLPSICDPFSRMIPTKNGFFLVNCNF